MYAHMLIYISKSLSSNFSWSGMSYTLHLYTPEFFLHMSILFFQVQVSIKVMFGNQWTQYFHNTCINHLSLKFILRFFVSSSLRDQKMKGTINSHSPSILLLSLWNRCKFLFQNNRPRPPFHLDLIYFGRTI